MSERIQHRYLLSNMLSDCCLKLLHIELDHLGVEVRKSKLGDISIAWNPELVSREQIETLFKSLGFGILNDKESVLIEEIKRVVIELVHHTTFNAMVRNSDFIVSRFDKSYQHLSTLFSRHENITLEKYIILQRIEKVKELLQSDELSLSEIAYMMGYSSVQYLSTQFKQITGYSVTDYKALPEKERHGIRLGNQTPS
ncbi:MAG: AraC family transcriptional regulator [Bacteroidales bacterium]|nr:AraC family transcriptional regulator [Bacteroidales bacterium]MDP2236586.1 AraC family transcriptional regulator [Bacteroidales bacterium]